MKIFSNLNMSCKDVFFLNKWNKKVGSPSSFARERPFISPNSSAFIENRSIFKRARARARANHAKNDAQKGCAMQLNGMTLNKSALCRSASLAFSFVKSQSHAFLPTSYDHYNNSKHFLVVGARGDISKTNTGQATQSKVQ